MVKKLGADNVGDNFVVEMKALGDQKQKAEVEIETLKMDLQRLEKLVVTEAHVSDALLQFEKVFDTLDFAEQRELIELLIREIPVSKRTQIWRAKRSIRTCSRQKYELRGTAFRFNSS